MKINPVFSRGDVSIFLASVVFIVICSWQTFASDNSLETQSTVALTSEQQELLTFIDSDLTRFDELIQTVSDETYKTFLIAKHAEYKEKSTALRTVFDQIKYDELKLNVLVDHQRVIAWKAPLQIPPPKDLLKVKMSAPSSNHMLGANSTVQFMENHCVSCHGKSDPNAGLDLTKLSHSLEAPDDFSRWVKIYDRVDAGEMPPDKQDRPNPADLSTFINNLSASLIAVDRKRIAREGRSVQRRLNAYEFENALHDLFQSPWIQIRAGLPNDGIANRFNKSGKALDISHVQIARFMSVADDVIRQAISRQAVQPKTKTMRFYARDQKILIKEYKLVPMNTWPDRQNFPLLGTQTETDVRWGDAPLTVGDTDPAKRELEAVGWVAKAFPKWDRTPITVSGRYRVRISGYTIWVGPNGYSGLFKRDDFEKIGKATRWHLANIDDVSSGRRDEPISVYATSDGQNRLLGGFDLTPEPQVNELEVWLDSKDSIVPAATRLYYPRPPLPTNPNAQRDGAPGVAFRWIEIDGPLYDVTTTAGYRLMFGDLPLTKFENNGNTIEVATTHPYEDAERLLRGFLIAAFRRPLDEDDVSGLLRLIHGQLNAGVTFAEAMIAGYTAALASPGFIVLQEQPGRLDDFALASRLSFFLWNSPPDEALRKLAASGELRKPQDLHLETERLLNDPKANRFVEAFLDYWLDLRKMEDTSPSITLYNDYYLDDELPQAALAESRLFFAELLKRDLPARNIVDSDFTFVNERLAKHYDIPNVLGSSMRKVKLPSDSPRGGLLTQASVLKVTANGTTTSPVLRGYWITERILGQEIPPPPPVGAVEPDIRGAVTIRQQLEKHRSDTSCASCHSKMDPPGFALENFDIFGGWRDNYRAISPGKESVVGFGKNGAPFEFHYGLPVDATGELHDGRAFANVRDFKRLLLADQAQERQIARNLAQQMVIYATGAPVSFSDRAEVERILDRTRTSEYGVRDILHEIVKSEMFHNK